jgi:acetyl-CoA synthetase
MGERAMTYERTREIRPDVGSYEEAVRSFTWHVPAHFNLWEDVCGRHAAGAAAGRTALVYEDAQGRITRLTFGELGKLAERFSAVLAAQGLQRGDRIAVLLPQRPETALMHLAAYRIGLVVIPLTILFRRDALEYRLHNGGARAIVAGAESLPLIAELLPRLPELRTVLLAGERYGERTDAGARGAVLTGTRARLRDLWSAQEQPGAIPPPADTRPDDPALIIYTSGTTGNPKGALHGHRVLIGHLPGFELSHNFCPQPGDCFWTPADWAWIGGLMDVLMPAWHHALPVVSWHASGAFDPERTLRMLVKHKVRNAFIPPTALKMMAQVPRVRARFKLALRSMMSGGEALGAATLKWAERELGVTINEIYGQTEINYLVGNCAPLWPVRPGSMGRPYPGHALAVLDERGKVLPPGEVGELAVLRQEDPVFFLEYWDNPEGTREKYAGEWARTGDLGVQDADGYLWFKGRADDVIISAGHRIGPTEIENTLQRHPAVAMAAVVASPDELRGDVVKAFIKLAPGARPGERLKREIQDFVKDTLARHEYPRKIEFVGEFPLTTTGKVLRRELRQRELANARR